MGDTGTSTEDTRGGNTDGTKKHRCWHKRPVSSVAKCCDTPILPVPGSNDSKQQWRTEVKVATTGVHLLKHRCQLKKIDVLLFLRRISHQVVELLPVSVIIMTCGDRWRTTVLSNGWILVYRSHSSSKWWRFFGLDIVGFTVTVNGDIVHCVVVSSAKVLWRGYRNIFRVWFSETNTGTLAKIPFTTIIHRMTEVLPTDCILNDRYFAGNCTIQIWLMMRTATLNASLLVGSYQPTYINGSLAKPVLHESATGTIAAATMDVKSLK